VSSHSSRTNADIPRRRGRTASQAAPPGREPPPAKPMALVPLSLGIADFEGGERPRKAFRQRAITWAMWVAARFAREGLELEVHAGEGAVGTEVALLPRTGRGNTQPGKGRGASLLLFIDRIEVEVCLEIQPASAAAQTLRGMVGLDAPPSTVDAPTLDALMDALARLPEQFEARTFADTSDDPGEVATETFVSAMDRDMIRAVAARLGPDGAPMRIGWRLPREVALEHAALLDEQLADALLSLAPLFRLLAGPRPQPPRSSGVPVRLSRAGRASIPDLKARATLHPVRPSIDPRERIALAIAAAKARTGTAPSLRVSGRTATLARPPRIIIPSSAGVGSGFGARRALGHGEVMIRGTRVRVLAGPFEGKEGVVQELDGKGGARVLLGLLATRLELVDLQPASRGGAGKPLGRPAFGTSHRRT
jgi:hypothetical protein